MAKRTGTMTDKTERLPYWPAALNKKLAAAYCGLSPETFAQVCPVKPISFTGSVRGERYLRQRLDEWLVSIDPNVDQKSKLRFEDFFSGHSQRSTSPKLDTWKRSTEPDPETGPSGYPIDDDPSSALNQYYNKLGFDPRTMSQSDMDRLRAEADERWKASVPGTPLQKREISALQALMHYEVALPVPWSQFKGLRHETGLRLQARGFVTLEVRDGNDLLSITEAGMAAARSL